MKTNPLQILLAEDDPGDAVLLRKGLSDAMDTPCEVIHATRLSETLQKLSDRKFDVILARRQRLRLCRQLVPKFSHQNKFFFG